MSSLFVIEIAKSMQRGDKQNKQAASFGRRLWIALKCTGIWGFVRIGLVEEANGEMEFTRAVGQSLALVIVVLVILDYHARPKWTGGYW